jgi:hypothetical protein
MDTPLAVIATLSKGYDLDYICKQVDCGPAKDAASYYIQAGESGESRRAAGGDRARRRWALNPGGSRRLAVRRAEAPDGAPLRRPPGSGRKAADIFARLIAAEPHATAERMHELRLEATRQAQESPLFLDLTLSPSKSISIFHASLGENARFAREAGDSGGDEYWSGAWSPRTQA